MLRFEIAAGKAYGALAVGFGARWLDKAAADRPHFITGLNALSGGQIVPVPGGVLVQHRDGTLLGPVVITGDTSDYDEAVANGDTAAVHHPAYDFNDEATIHGIANWIQLTESLLNDKSDETPVT